ncbi:FAD/NAD(P)-binding domain [Phytophthora cactorum]|nr:FAD/NAD(P)-binding domain [Phytophthora cactorum]
MVGGEEAERKQKARADKEVARQKVRQFLLEEEQEHAKRKGSGNDATIKSVDESTVRRETVVDDYGKVNLLDYLDRVADDGHRSRNGGSVPSEMDDSSPPSDASSPRSVASSLEADTSTPFTQGDDVSPPTSSTLSGMGSRFAQFLHRGPSNGPEDSHTPRARRLIPPSPFHSKSSEKMSLEAAFHATKLPEPAVYGATSARMTPLLATMDQIAHTCQKNELSEVSIARISTLLTSINQIVRDDIQKHRGQPNRIVRRLSGAHWVKNEQERHEHEKPHRAPMPPPKPEIRVNLFRSFLPLLQWTRPDRAFDAAQNLIETLSCFNKLLTECGLSGVKVDEPWRVYSHIKAGVYSKLGFRHKQLFKLLDARFNMDVYKRKPAAKKRVCIIGAGPVGLRAAVETALLGGQVVVLEKRKHFSRENILHLWPWVVQDLTALGAKVFFPSFCHSTAYFHVGTRQLQVILLKVALLVGVTVYSSTAFEAVISPNSEESDNKPFYTVATQPQIPWMEFTAVLGASGTNDKLAEPAGINRFVFSRKEALGIVCYFPNLGTTEEKKVTEFSWTIQFKQQMFAKMREIGVDLENIVYYRGEMHYIVMTPKRQNLLDQKVLKVNHPEPRDLVQDDNINKNTLHEYVKRIVAFLGVPKKAEFSRIRMFDFSSRTRADKAASILTSHGKKLYVGLIGDSLIEPFWPEGVGTCRGFLGALDGVWMVAQIGKKADEQLLADREMAYRVIQHVSGFRRDDLQKNVRKYTVDPKSRYTVKFPQLYQATAPRTSKRSLRKLERRPPVHDGSREVTSARDRQDAYIGEDPFDGNDLDHLDRLSAINAHNRQSRKLLDYLAGDKYLDDAENGDDIIDGEDEGFYSDEPRSRRHQSIPYTSAPPGATVVNPNEINSDQLGQIVAEEAERKQKARAEKELAWQKVRQLLIEEEEKASAMSIDSTSKSVDSSRGEKDEDNINTVKLLDSLVRSGADDFAYNRSVSSDVDVAPVVDSSLAQCQVSASNSTASTGSTSEFLNRGQTSDDESNDLLKSRRFYEPFVAGKSSVRLALLATLEQVTRTVQRTELSEESMLQISTLLTSIDQIAREDMNKKNGQQKRGFRRLSSSQWPKSGNALSDQKPVPPAARVVPTALNSFKAFEAAQDLGDTLAAFSNLLNDCGLNGIKVDESWHVFFHIKAAVYSKLSFRHKQLFKLLDARFNLDVYTRKHAARKRVCIIGAGPVGLRAAVETALLGGQVIVLEKREQFSRENMLHLWPWVVQDLVSLGAKVFFPQFGKSSSYFHVSMRQLQVILLKVALLIGVTVYPSTDFESIERPGLEESGGLPFYTVVTRPQIPVMEFTAVLGASGTSDKLAQPAGISRFVYSNKEALGIVCYFPNLGTSDETKAKEFSWTAQLKHPMLDKLREIGLDLENVVYYRGEMHYLVMTPKRQNLVDLRVVNEDRPSSTDLVMDDNINNSALHEFVKSIVDFAGIPRKTDFTRVSLFDFSALTRADKAASVLLSHGKKLYVGLIGDSLLEPVWHDGWGPVAAFWVPWTIGRKSDEHLLADREAAYQVTMRLSGNHREEMQKNVRKYTVDPRSRYTSIMDEDEDTYGFGSFADLFDVGPARVAKRLDVGALSRFCMSERLLSRFEQQQRRDKRVVLYQHVAAKFDGVRIDGGLGALGVAPLEGGGIVWLQTTQSDSDALERRKKELQDITNRQNNGEHKSAAALFVAFKHVAAVQPTTVQNTVQSVEIKLVDGNRLDLTFMPGPFAGPKHRDEFLETLKKQMSGGSKDMQETVKTAAVHTSVRRSGATSEAKRKTVNSKSKEKEKFRQLVRRYTRLDPMSEEALAVAKQVYAGTGYYLGPTTNHTPKFTEDAEYRKKTVAKLSDCLKRMNQEWSEADAHRELHTKAKHSRNEDDLFEYTDTVTGAQIPTRTYEQRYLEYVKAHEVNPVLHMFPVQDKTKDGEKAKSSHGSESAASSEPGDNARSRFIVLDISSNCIIDSNFFSVGADDPPPMYQRAEGRTRHFELQWTALGRIYGPAGAQLLLECLQSQSSRKRPRDRRQSLVLPTSNDLQSTLETKRSRVENGTASYSGNSHDSRTKRSRSTADAAQKSQRKARRQSIVNTVDLPSIGASGAEEKTAAEKRKTSQSSRKSPRPRHPANGYARETSSLEMVADDDSSLCKLCYSEEALVHMKPCDHSVCSACWTRLPPASGMNGTGSRRVCPWDRELSIEGVSQMIEQRVAGHSRGEVKARLQQDERMEEEEFFLSLSKALPVGQVQAAALRNYQAAGKLRWKRLMFQSLAEQQQLDEELTECTFRPRLVAKPRRAVCRSSKSCRSSCAAAANSTNQPKVPSARRGKLAGGDVFERLYNPQANAPATAIVSQHGSTAKRISSQAEAAFIARQERDQVDRQRRRSELAAQLHHFPHKPKLSKHSQEICAALRENDTDQFADHRQREQKSFTHTKHVRYTVPPCTSVVYSKQRPDHTFVPFTTIVNALKEQRNA